MVGRQQINQLIRNRIKYVHSLQQIFLLKFLAILICSAMACLVFLSIRLLNPSCHRSGQCRLDNLTRKHTASNDKKQPAKLVKENQTYYSPECILLKMK